MITRDTMFARRLLWLTVSCTMLSWKCYGEPTAVTMLGPGSCASSTCHGAVVDPKSPPTWRTSFSVWEASDPHAQAGIVLFNELSTRIAIQLDPATKDSVQAFHQLLQRRCISCHATAAAGITDQATSADVWPEILAMGVSCESCHGGASGWLSKHTQRGWPDDPQRLVPPHGMRDTEHWLPNVDGCLRCHVGSHTADGMVRDMNHDLIAAGHPQLRFEPSDLMSRLPRHWSEKPVADVAASPSGNLREGAQWRLLATQARLSQERMAAALSSKDVPVPEFSEFDCSACHHDLLDRSLAKQPVRTKAAGWTPWQPMMLDSTLANAQLLQLPMSAFRSQADREKISAELARFESQCLQRSDELVPQENAPNRPRGTGDE
jgi:Cytochrome c554 and c-prime